ncbi:PMT family glycosyltransferase, 4-amino-4-deoxy-L-arabinose transferase [Desulfocurvibacter africanus PCS]|uniref:PMT family glycosyltransferase, 4-amino-4-deoxy-L-arabinose transferase n=2 Tax=Desulfocurvibacter africanus TaxID=873 RepID=M5PRX0_DESAF|nr:PMT family glycosyltransferase, 4-amino-4-deoxy-L-arabinose transferase [Desulfocurvibacter africanus PCS]
MSFPWQDLRNLLTLLAVCGATFFAHADLFPVSRMEARNLVAAREMVQDGHWLIPTMNGSLRLAKPPLPTWLSAAAGLTVGNTGSLAALRFPSALAATFMVFAAYGLTGTILRNRRSAFLTAAVLATSYLTISSGRHATWDIFCHSFMLLALWAMVAGMNKTGPALIEAVLAGVFLGLSFMSKGPVSFFAMLLPFVLSYGFTFGWRALLARRREIALTVAALLVVALPWPLYVFTSVSGQAASTLQGEVAAWGSRHVKSLFYYANFPFMSGIWSLFAIAALLFPSAKQGTADPAGRKFCLIWLAAVLLLLSLTPEKKERYMLPAMVPLAMLVGGFLDGLIHEKVDQQGKTTTTLLRLHAGILALASLTVPAVAAYLLRSNFLAIKLSLVVVTGVYAALALGFASTLASVKAKRILALTIVLIAASGALLPPLASSAGLFRRTYSRLAAIRSESQVQGLELYYQGNVDERMVWHAGRHIAHWRDMRGMPTLPLAMLSRVPLATQPDGFEGQAVSIRLVASYCVDEPKCANILYLSIVEKGPVLGR